MRVIFSSVVKRNKPLKKSNKQKQSNYLTKTPCELNYDDTDSDIVMDCVILNILKILGKSLVTARLTKGFRSKNVFLCVCVLKKYFPHLFQLSTHHHFLFLSV